MADRYVYLIRCGPVCKIGSSGDPAGRLKQLFPDGGGELLHQFPSANSYQVETALHHRFASSRHEDGPGREWFGLGADDVIALCGLGRIDAPDDLPAHLRPEAATPRTTAKLSADVHRKARTVASDMGLDLAGYLDLVLRPVIEMAYKDLGRRILEEMG